MLGLVSRYAFNPRFVKFFVVPNIIFTIIALITDAPSLIAILNLVVIALSVNVCVAFMPNVIDVIFGNRELDKADWLTLGIFSAWSAIVLGTMISLFWRYFGRPDWLIDTDLTSFRLFMLGFAAVCHLASPGSLRESIPPRRWIKIGSWIALAVFVALLLLYLSDARRSPHDLLPGHTRYIVPL